MLAVLMLAVVLVPTASAVDPAPRNSNADVGFREGELEIPRVPCEDPYGHLFPPYCPPGYEPTQEFFVPNFDFGEHPITLNQNRTYYAIPAQGTNRFIYGTLYPLVAADITGRTPGAANTVGHYMQISDARGSLAGWGISVSRTEFFTTDAWTAAGGAVPTVATDAQGLSNALQGVEMIFHDVEAFGVATPTEQIVNQFATDMPVPVGTSNVFANAVAGRGNGVQRIQFGETTPYADANLAHTYREYVAAPASASVAEGTAFARNEGVSLNVPAAVVPRPENYRARLTWTISLAPAAGGVWTAPVTP